MTIEPFFICDKKCDQFVTKKVQNTSKQRALAFIAYAIPLLLIWYRRVYPCISYQSCLAIISCLQRRFIHIYPLKCTMMP